MPTWLRHSRLAAGAVLATCAAALCAGCGEPAAEEPPLVVPAAAPNPVSTPAPVAVNSTPTSTSAPPDAKSESEKESAKPTEAEYQVPFPDRTELFIAPKRQGSAIKQEGAFEQSVELLGFVNVGEVRAVLNIAGQIAPVAAGDKKYGIEVISVSPPNVVLQRGRQRWPLTLEN